MNELKNDVNSSGNRMIGVRHYQTILHILFYAIIYGIEISLTLTIIDMIDPSNKHSKALANFPVSDVSFLFQSYLIGFLITNLFSACICKKYGYKWPMVVSMIHISAITIFLPYITKSQGYSGMVICRIIQGLCTGIIYPMPADFISKWVPVNERTTLGTAVYAGSRLGEAVAIFLWVFGPAAKGDWPFFYMQCGYIAILWVVFMVIFGADSPEKYTGKISENELNYIIGNRGNAKVNSKVKIPWIRMCTSMSVWAIIVAQIGASWLYYVLSFYIPLYLTEFYHLHAAVGQKGIVVLISWISSFVISLIAKCLINKGVTSTGQSRKLFNIIGCLVPSIFFILFMFEWQGEDLVAYFIWTLMFVASMGTICGSKINIHDISTNCAPAILGISTWMGPVFTIIFLQLLQFNDLQGWRTLMGFTVLLLLVTNIFFTIFGSGEEQEWDIYSDFLEEEEDIEKDLSKSASYVSCDEKKYLLYVTKTMKCNEK